MIQGFDSHRLHVAGRHFGKTRVFVFGTIRGERYEYARLYESEEVAPGEVPEEFKRDARIAFVRTYLRLREGLT